MNFSHFKQALPIIALILILTAVYWLNFQSSHVVEGDSCQLERGRCTTRVENLDVEVKVTNPILIEEEIPLQINFPDSLTLRRGWIEGINMFMGKSVLDLAPQTSTDEVRKGVFFLGSCSEPVMYWKIVLELEDISTGERQYRYYLFQTSL